MHIDTKLDLMRLTYMIDKMVGDARLLADFIPYPDRNIVNLKAALKQAHMVSSQAHELAQDGQIKDV